MRDTSRVLHVVGVGCTIQRSGFLGAQAKVVRLIRHAVLEEVGIADEGVARIAVRTIQEAGLFAHLRRVEALES